MLCRNDPSTHEVYIVQEGEFSLGAEQETESVQVDPSQVEMTTQISVDLFSEVSEGMINYLWRNQDIFALTPKDLMELNLIIMEYHLNIMADARLVKQKHQHFSPEKDKVIQGKA